MPIIDVFIALKMRSKGNDPKTGQIVDKPEREAGGRYMPVPDWKAVQRIASLNESVVNIFEEESGTCNKNSFLKSLTTPSRIVVFAGHSWQDGRIRNGRVEAGRRHQNSRGAIFWNIRYYTSNAGFLRASLWRLHAHSNYSSIESVYFQLQSRSGFPQYPKKSFGARVCRLLH